MPYSEREKQKALRDQNQAINEVNKSGGILNRFRIKNVELS